MASEVVQLMETIKRQLKAQGKTYRDVAHALRLSEPSVKRLFATGRFSIDRIAAIGKLLGYTLAELTQAATDVMPTVQALEPQQEKQLMSDPQLLLVAVCALNHWSMNEMLAAYRIAPTACLKHLLVLDRMGLIELLPGNRIRLRVARDFDWRPDGPIRRFFREEGLADFLDAAFDDDGEVMDFSHGMLTRSASTQMQLEIRRVRARLASLHAESATSPVGERRGTGLFFAMREWEPEKFRRLRQTVRTREGD
jgi:transcriptional regulator with XRE-family HTH domain